MDISRERRGEIIAALRKGTVPQRGLDFLAVGLGRFESVIAQELANVAQGGAVFKAVRGDYGCGKTFFGRWVQENAKKSGFATAEVQISETETPLHRLETVYRRAMEQLSTADCFLGAFRSILDGWFYGLEEDVLAEGNMDPSDEVGLARCADELLEQRLVEITRATPQFAAALRTYRSAQRQNDHATAEGLAGQPHVAASIKRAAGVKGDVDHFAALSFLRGLLLILKDSGYSGLVLVLDEIETLQRARGDVREKGLNALRQLIDDIDGGRFPNLYLLTTGTPAFFDGPQGVQRLEPLAQRLHVDFQTDPRFDNPRAVQLRLASFDHERLVEVGIRVRDLFLAECSSRIRTFKNFPMTCQSLQSVAAYLKFDWSKPHSFRELFKARLFDYLGKLDIDGVSEWFTRRSRFSSSVPLEYAYAAWGQLPKPGAGKGDVFADFRAVTRDLLTAFQVRRLCSKPDLTRGAEALLHREQEASHDPPLCGHRSARSAGRPGGPSDSGPARTGEGLPQGEEAHRVGLGRAGHEVHAGEHREDGAVPVRRPGVPRHERQGRQPRLGGLGQQAVHPRRLQAGRR
jgi:hypothetical protein